MFAALFSLIHGLADVITLCVCSREYTAVSRTRLTLLFERETRHEQIILALINLHPTTLAKCSSAFLTVSLAASPLSTLGARLVARIAFLSSRMDGWCRASVYHRVSSHVEVDELFFETERKICLVVD